MNFVAKNNNPNKKLCNNAAILQYSLHKESDASKKAYPSLAQVVNCVDCVKLKCLEFQRRNAIKVLCIPRCLHKNGDM